MAASASPLCVSACELIAGVHDVHLAAGAGGGEGAEAGPDASDAGPDASDAGPDASDTGPDAGDAGLDAGDTGPDACPGADAAAPASADAGVTTPVPPGYARYCSGPGDEWHGGADPCAYVLDAGIPVTRAGLYAANGWNRVLLRCQGFNGDPPSFAGNGAVPIDMAFNMMENQKLHACVYIVAPASLPVFSLPYGVSPCATRPRERRGPDGLSLPGLQLRRLPPTMGRRRLRPDPVSGRDSGACAVDRTGREQCHIGTASECGGDAGCMIVPTGSRPTGLTYAWSMPAGKPLLAVANGTVVGSRDRDVSDQGCGATSLQKEIFIQHEIVGAGASAATYAERFVTGYLGVGEREVEVGDTVAAGQEIGKAGATGCVMVPSLNFLVLRLTNLTAATAYTFETTDGGAYGFNGIQGVIDPFGWAAPLGTDPWSFRYLGWSDPNGFAPGVSGQAPSASTCGATAVHRRRSDPPSPRRLLCPLARGVVGPWLRPWASETSSRTSIASSACSVAEAWAWSSPRGTSASASASPSSSSRAAPARRAAWWRGSSARGGPRCASAASTWCACTTVATLDTGEPYSWSWSTSRAATWPASSGSDGPPSSLSRRSTSCRRSRPWPRRTPGG